MRSNTIKSITEKIPIGASAEKSVSVTPDLTVAHFHDHMPEVYGTPMMVYLMEVASAAAIQAYGEGVHVRAPVEMTRFNQRVEEKAAIRK